LNEFIFKVLHDPKATTCAEEERNLAVALGYPTTWRVHRKLIKKEGGQEKDKDKERESTEGEDQIEIMDVIYAGNPQKGVDRWYNHEAAMVASLESTGPYHFKGGQMLKAVAKFAKDDEVEVRYKREWYAATISRRKKVEDGFRYSVIYTEDDSTQDDILESKIRAVNPDAAALRLAKSMDLPSGWKAVRLGKSCVMTAPDGRTFKTKKAAKRYIDALEAEAAALAAAAASGVGDADGDGDGDPPWRTTGHEYIGRSVVYSHEHRTSGTRTAKINQNGIVMGWIAETDKDSQGDPGYVSDKTGKPAALFYVQFEDLKTHAYPKFLLHSIDMELHEVEEVLVPEELQGQPSPKKNRYS